MAKNILTIFAILLVVLNLCFISSCNTGRSNDYSIDTSWKKTKYLVEFQSNKHGIILNITSSAKESESFDTIHFILQTDSVVIEEFAIVSTLPNEQFIYPHDTKHPLNLALQDGLNQEAITIREAEFLASTPLIINHPSRLILPGDLVFQDLDCGDLCDAIEDVTKGHRGSRLSHVGIVSHVSPHCIMILEATGDKVQETKWEDFYARSWDVARRPKILIGRIKDQKMVNKALSNAFKYLGDPYDKIFDINNESYYCSELAYFSYWIEDSDSSLFDLDAMTFKRFDSVDYDSAWIDYFQELKEPIPEGEPGLNPGSISLSENLDILYLMGYPDGYKNNQ